jgi:hypothetical protein
MAQLGAPERAVALAEGYDSFFALCRKHTPSTSHGRYAGVRAPSLRVNPVASL